MGSCVKTTGQSRPDCEIFIVMVVHHRTEGTAGRECIEDKYKVKNRKRKASEDENYVEEVGETDRSVPDSEVEEQSSEKYELSRLKKLIPTVSIKDNVTQLDIRHIDSLRDRLDSTRERDVDG